MKTNEKSKGLYKSVLKNVNPSYKGLVKQLDKGLTTKHLYFNTFEFVLPHGRGACATSAIIFSILYALEKDWELRQSALEKEKELYKNIKSIPKWHTAKTQDRKIVGHVAVLSPQGYSPREMMKQFAWCMEKLGVDGSYTTTLSQHRFEHRESGARICFLQADKFDGWVGKFKYLYCYGADSLVGYGRYLGIVDKAFTYTKPETNTFSFVEYNVPSSVRHWTYHSFTSRHNGVCFKKFLGSYLTVPKDWLGDAFFVHANKLKREDRLLYSNEYLGKPISIFERN